MALPHIKQPEGPITNPDFKKRDFNDLDGLLQELSKDRQNFDPPPPPPGSEPQPGFQQPPFHGPGSPPEFSEREPITHDQAVRAGRRAAVLTDQALSVLGMAIAKEQNPESYKASPGEVSDMADAWAEVTEEYSFKINPWINIVFLILMIYTPKLIKASNDRRIKQLQEEQEKQARQIKELQDKANQA